MLDSLAAQIADAVRPKVAEMGKNGIVELLPSPLDVDPEAQDDSTVKALDAVVQRFDVGGDDPRIHGGAAPNAARTAGRRGAARIDPGRKPKRENRIGRHRVEHPAAGP